MVTGSLQSGLPQVLARNDEPVRQTGTLEKENNAVKEPAVQKEKAVYTVDNENQVFVKILNAMGETIKTLPPEKYLEMKDSQKDTIQHLFHVEV